MYCGLQGKEVFLREDFCEQGKALQKKIFEVELGESMENVYTEKEKSLPIINLYAR